MGRLTSENIEEYSNEGARLGSTGQPLPFASIDEAIFRDDALKDKDEIGNLSIVSQKRWHQLDSYITEISKYVKKNKLIRPSQNVPEKLMFPEGTDPVNILNVKQGLEGYIWGMDDQRPDKEDVLLVRQNLINDILHILNPGMMPDLDTDVAKHVTFKQSTGYALAYVVKTFREKGVNLEPGQYPIDAVSRSAAGLSDEKGYVRLPTLHSGQIAVVSDERANEVAKYSDALALRDTEIEKAHILLIVQERMGGVHAKRVSNYVAKPEVFRAFREGLSGKPLSDYKGPEKGKIASGIQNRMSVAHADGYHLRQMQE